MFLNEGEKENKREEGGGGIEIGQRVRRRKKYIKKIISLTSHSYKHNDYKHNNLSLKHL